MTDRAPWDALCAPIPTNEIEWRQDGKVSPRQGKFFARFVPYMTAQFARKRLDESFPGQWDCTLMRLDGYDTVGRDGTITGHMHVFQSTIMVAGIQRSDVGEGDSPKSAATDAFKRACTRFGMAQELYTTEPNWVEVDSDSKFAKALEDPMAAYLRKHGRPGAVAQPAPVTYKDGPPPRTDVIAAPLDFYPETPEEAAARNDAAVIRDAAFAKADAPAGKTTDPLEPATACPDCGGGMYDNRATKTNPKAPDFKCKDKGCGGVIWPPKAGAKKAAPAPKPVAAQVTTGIEFKDTLDDDGSELPF